jgi:hypothetical protein
MTWSLGKPELSISFIYTHKEAEPDEDAELSTPHLAATLNFEQMIADCPVSGIGNIGLC